MNILMSPGSLETSANAFHLLTRPEKKIQTHPNLSTCLADVELERIPAAAAAAATFPWYALFAF